MPKEAQKELDATPDLLAGPDDLEREAVQHFGLVQPHEPKARKKKITESAEKRAVLVPLETLERWHRSYTTLLQSSTARYVPASLADAYPSMARAELEMQQFLRKK